MGVKIAQYLLPQVDEVVICSPTYALQPTWDPIRSRVTKATDLLDPLIKHVRERGSDEKRPKMLLILDDVSYERRLNEGNKGALNGLFYNAFWLDLSILVICHKISNVGSGMKENLENLILFQTINNSEVDKLAELYSVTGDKNDFKRLYREFVIDPILARTNLHPFLHFNWSNGVRVISNMTDEISLKNASAS